VSEAQASTPARQTLPRGNEALREVLRIYTLVMVAIVIGAIAALFVPWLDANLYALVALIFFVVPTRLVDRDARGADHYGTTMERWFGGTAWGLLATLITIPGFVVGFWVWEAEIRDREFSPSADAYFQWADDTWHAAGDVQSPPTVERPGVDIWAERDTLRIRFAADQVVRPLGPAYVRLEADQGFEPYVRGGVAKPMKGRDRASPVWEITRMRAAKAADIRVEGPRTIRVSVHSRDPGAPAPELRVGASAESRGEWQGRRGLSWILLWALTQLLLIALPEELFYRGWIQTRLVDAFEDRARPELWAIVLTSVLFAVGHFVVPVGGALSVQRLAVFFPALVFGWLRVKTGSITAGVVYHAACNLMVLLAAVHFQ
jgi:membrane protease YdiL (CAAX protease family)